jgi:hypothetical protein
MIKKNKKILLKKNNKKKLNLDKIAICLLGYQPTNELLELYDGLYKGDKYDIYVIVDDNNYDVLEKKKRFKDFNFIKVKEETCYKYGYTHLAYTVKKGEPSAWDKGIYYFCEENKIDYKYVWFIEDDVFIPLPTTIKDIDDKYNREGFVDLLVRSDKLVKKNKISIPYQQKEELNKYMEPELKSYLSKSMICAIRVSENLLQKVKLYAKKHHYLFFSEYIFVTLAKYYGLKIKSIEELKNIIFRKIWTIDDIFKEQHTLFHPVKDFFLQQSFRKTLKPNDVYFLLKRVFKKNLLEDTNVVFNNMYLLQIFIFKNKEGSILRIIQETSINDNTLYLEIEKKYQSNIFRFKMQIKSMEEINTFLSILKYKFVAYQNIIRDHYIYKKNVNIYLTNIPGIFEFVHFESHSEEKLKEAYHQLGYTGEELKTLKEVIEESDIYFGLKTYLNMSIEIEKKDKILKYVKKNKDIMKKLLDKQYKLYKNILELFGDKIKIYNRINFITSEN